MLKIEKDERFELAERYVMHTGVSLFLTGRAGTGKTTFLKYIQDHCPKRHIVLAPTGVAAINAGGSTIHSFFQLPLCPYLPDVPELLTEYQMQKGRKTLRKERITLIRTLELLIIDEISMVRADLLDAVDMMLRRYRHRGRPFGGVQLLLIGDAQQLSPVVKEDEAEFLQRVYPSPYFFESKALRQVPYATIELTTVYRQKNAAFLDILNAIRENRITDDLLRQLNARVGAPCEGAVARRERTEPIHLMTHNRQANQFNDARLEALRGRATVFKASVTGEFPENSYPAEQEIRLKKGAQVMFLKNDPAGEYYNGKLSTVIDIAPGVGVTVRDEDGLETEVGPVEWENVRYALDEETGEITQSTVGVFRQLPLRTAWAITIHKSQGLTFDNVIIDAGAAFAFGQVYVALSRCRSLEGISLDRPIRASAIYTDAAVAGFNASLPQAEQVTALLPQEETRYRTERMMAVFDLSDTVHLTEWARELWSSHLQKVYPGEATRLTSFVERLRREQEIADRFRQQISRLAAAGDEALLQERLKKGAAYFLPVFQPVQTECRRMFKLSIGNKEVKKRVKAVADELLVNLSIKCLTLGYIRDHGFDVAACNRIRTACLLK